MIRKLPDEVHRELKKLCAEKEITINDFLIKLITKEVKKKQLPGY